MNEQQPQEGTATVPETEATGQPQQGTNLDDVAALRAELNQARKEAAKYRTAAQKAADAEDLRKRAEMSELEKLKADMAKLTQQAQEAEARAQRATAKAAIMRAANGFNDPDDALRMIDLDALEVGEDGAIAGLDEAIAKLLKEKPYLSKTNRGSISPTNPQSGAQNETDAQRRARLFGNQSSPIWNTAAGVQMPE